MGIRTQDLTNFKILSFNGGYVSQLCDLIPSQIINSYI